jgi:hypothetical protein
MAQTLQSLYAIPSIVPQLGLTNTFSAINTFSVGLVSQGISTISNYGTPYSLPNPGSTSGNWYTLGQITFNGGSGSAARIEIFGSSGYTTGSFISGHDVIELRMGNNTGSSSVPDVTGNYYRIGDASTSPIVAGTLKLVSVNSSVTDNQYTIWYQSNTNPVGCRVYFYSSDTSFTFSGTYQSSGDPSLTVSNPTQNVYVVPNTFAVRGTTISTIGRLLVNSPTDNGVSAFIVNGTSTLSTTNVVGTLTVYGGVQYITSLSTQSYLYFQYNNAAANQVYLSMTSSAFTINYTNSSGSLVGAALTISPSTGATTISQALTVGGSVALNSGALSLGVAAGTVSQISLNSAAGYNRTVAWQTAGTNRWAAYANSTAESGSNVGSDLVLANYSDAGAQLSQAVTITRATGIVTLANGLTSNGVVTVSTAATNGLVVTSSTTTTSSIQVVNTSTGGRSWSLFTTGSGASPTAVGCFGLYDNTASATRWYVDTNGISYFTTSGQATTISVTDTGTSGANILMTGNGSTTPGKTMRVVAGQWQIINSAYNNIILALTDAGAMTLTSTLAATGGTFKASTAETDVLFGFNNSLNNGAYLACNSSGLSICMLNSSGGFNSISATFNPAGVIIGQTLALTSTSTSSAPCLAISGQAAIQLKYMSSGAAYFWGPGGSGDNVLNFSGSSSNYNLTLFGQGYASNWIISSDQRIKTWIKDLDGTEELSKLMCLTSRMYIKGGKQELGFYAQDVDKLWSPMVEKSKHDSYEWSDFHTLDTNMIHAVHVSATQEIYRQVQELQRVVGEQQLRIFELENRNGITN